MNVLGSRSWVLGPCRRVLRSAVVIGGLLALLPSRPLAGQTPPQPTYSADSAAVTHVIRQALLGLMVRDTTHLAAFLHPSMPIRIASDRRNGTPDIVGDDRTQWLRSIAAGSHTVRFDERLGPLTIQIDGNLASGWAYYEFFLSGNFSHCGADQFTLGRTEQGWKLIQLAYSARRQGCTPHLPPLAGTRELALREMVAAERAFAHYADTAGINKSFLWGLAPDAITLDSNGVKPMRPIYERRTENGAALRWAPSWADMAADGSMGVTTGPWSWAPHRDSTVLDRGNFLTVWVKGPERWQAAMDIGVGGDSTARLDEPITELSPAVTGRGRLEDVLTIDRTRIRGRGWVAALRALTAPEARILRDGRVRGTGPAGIEGNASTRFTPLGGRVATSGDLAATWGTWQEGRKKGPYVRIWRNTPEGWRVVVDLMGG